ncbi:MAG TPA: cytidylate kinase [archaeon]|nr:cytidylate kinase [archaeon]
MVAITVSGWAGSGKSTLAKRLATTLKMEYFSVGTWFRKKATDAGMNIADFMKVAPKELHNEVDDYVKQIAREKNVVIDARLAGWMAPDADFKIFLTAPVEERARRASEREDTPLEEETQNVIRRDDQDIKNYLEIYGINLKDMGIYDLVLNTARLDADEVAEIVELVVRKAVKL